MRKPTASAITSGGSAMCESFSRIIRTGSSATGCAKFSKKFTLPWQDDLSTARRLNSVTTEDAEVAEIRRHFPQTFGARLRPRVIRGIRVAHASRVLVSASRRNSLSKGWQPIVYFVSSEEFTMARTPSPPRETRALPINASSISVLFAFVFSWRRDAIIHGVGV